MFGQKRIPSREGGVEIVVEELCTRMVALNVSIALGNKVSLFLGRISYEVYLIHGAVFGLMATFMPGINSGLFISLSIVITVALSWVVNLMSRPVIKKVNSLLVSN